MLPRDHAPQPLAAPDAEIGNADSPLAEPLVPSRTETALRNTIEWLVVIVGALAIALLLKTYVFQVFNIPSSSMYPALETGDRIFVNKLDDDPERGNIVVFRAPDNFTLDDTEHLVKRVIGLPGETLTIVDGRVHIDSVALSEPYLDPEVSTPGDPWHERCANNTLDDDGCVIPDGWYFMLGDNREASQDGRIFGPIDGSLIEGHAVLRIYPLAGIGGLDES